MSLFQIGFLALVFIGSFALVYFVVQLVGGNAAAGRMKRLLGDAAVFDSPTERWRKRPSQ